MHSKTLVDGHTHVGVELMFYLRGHYPYALDWANLVRLGENSGIGAFVVFPMVSNISLNVGGLREGKLFSEGALEAVPYAFENRRLMVEIERYIPEHSSKAYPLWMIDPSRKQEAQVAALRELRKEFRCSGLKIQATVIQSFIRDLLGSGRCLMEFAQEQQLPILIHTSYHPEDPWSQVDDILAIAEAWPGVRFCLAHSCRFYKQGLDRVAELPNTWFDCSAHRIHCHLAVQNSLSIPSGDKRFPSDYTDPVKVLGDMAQAYPNKLIWGSDAPFDSYIDHNISLRSSYKEEADVLHQLDQETVFRIAHQNTFAFLNGIS